MVALALPTTTLLGEKRRLEMLNGGVVLSPPPPQEARHANANAATPERAAVTIRSKLGFMCILCRFLSCVSLCNLSQGSSTSKRSVPGTPGRVCPIGFRRFEQRKRAMTRGPEVRTAAHDERRPALEHRGTDLARSQGQRRIVNRGALEPYEACPFAKNAPSIVGLGSSASSSCIAGGK